MCMNLVDPDDSRKLLIDTFFAIILTIGFENFLLHFGVTENFNKLTFSKETFFSLLFFFSTYFWVISHWIFYHELIKRYPYRRWSKFFVDITLFSLMFVILNISFGVSNSIRSLYLFILLVSVWYLLACLWHMSDKEFRSPKRYYVAHLHRFCAYLSLFAVLLYFSLLNPLSLYSRYGELIRDAIMIGTVIAIIAFNVTRLDKFILRKQTTSECCLFFYDGTLAEFPECYSANYFPNK